MGQWVTGAIGVGEAEAEFFGHEAGDSNINKANTDTLATGIVEAHAVPMVSGSVKIVGGDIIDGGVEVPKGQIDTGSASELGIEIGSKGGTSMPGDSASEMPELQTDEIRNSHESSGQASICTGHTTVLSTGGSLGVETETHTENSGISGVSEDSKGDAHIGSSVTIFEGIGDGSAAQSLGSATAVIQGAGIESHFLRYRAPNRSTHRRPMPTNRPFRPRAVYGAPPPKPQYGAVQTKPKTRNAPPTTQLKPQFEATPPQPKSNHQYTGPRARPKPQHRSPRPKPLPQYGAPQPQSKSQYGPPPPQPKRQYGPPKTERNPAHGPPHTPTYGSPRPKPRPVRPLGKTPPVVKVSNSPYPPPRPSSHYEPSPPTPPRVHIRGYQGPVPQPQYGTPKPAPIKSSEPRFPAPRPYFQHDLRRPVPITYGAPTPVKVANPRPQYGPPRSQLTRPGYAPAGPGSNYR